MTSSFPHRKSSFQNSLSSQDHPSGEPGAMAAFQKRESAGVDKQKRKEKFLECLTKLGNRDTNRTAYDELKGMIQVSCPFLTMPWTGVCARIVLFGVVGMLCKVV